MRRLILAVVITVAGSQGSAFELSSPDIVPGATVGQAQVFDRLGCRGDNLSPALAWKDPPARTRSFAVTVYDPDAPRGWWHWLLIDIPPQVHLLARGIGLRTPLPQGAKSPRNDFGMAGYGGPCPPAGDRPHRYEFVVQALDVEHLDIAPEASPATVAASLAAHSLGKAGISASYQR